MRESKKDIVLLAKIKWEACRRNPEFRKKFEVMKAKNKGDGVKRILEVFFQELTDQGDPKLFEAHLSRAIYEFDIDKDFEQNIKTIEDTYGLCGLDNKKSLLWKIVEMLPLGAVGCLSGGIPVYPGICDARGAFTTEDGERFLLTWLNKGMLYLSVNLSFPLKQLMHNIENVVRVHQQGLEDLNPQFKIKKEKRPGRRTMEKVDQAIPREKVNEIFNVYDLCEIQKKSFRAIAKTLWPQDYQRWEKRKADNDPFWKNPIIQRAQDYHKKAREWISNPVEIR